MEWRQFAIASRVSPGNVDRFLLQHADVPDSVKNLIKKELESQGQSLPPTEVVQLPERPVSSDPSGGQPAIDQGVTAPVAGEVTMLDAKARLEEIKKEAFDQEERTQEETADQTTREQQENAQTEIIAQTAEKKEVPTTAGTQNTAQGMASRAMMFGYQPSKTVASNLTELSEKGDVRSAKTWQAVMLRRLMEMWGSITSLFSQQN